MDKFSLVVVSTVVFFCFTKPTAAASDNECAIWLCLPGGFPEGCGSAKMAMVNRIAKGKSPLPPFSSCAIKDEDFLSYDYNYAALIREQRVCTKWGSSNRERCLAYKAIPEHYVKGTRCVSRGGIEEPSGCIATRRYVDIYINGQKSGNTYYW
ncbi:conjugal transfer protein TraL [Marinobacterium arenosum]|uniref:conjugal transfer protein TraL n=1 Tax=Marinobacterium arenosum TaxID=2862496 RepID=UPI001C96DBD2|nr:conjugal transfer protein TraL [Marinobacterium arenosum]MBY4679154.1 conjugal transfer protein TraL [Marinobacterium arenosum]